MGNVFYNYIQALIKITDVSYLSRERVKSTFWEDFKILSLREYLLTDFHLIITITYMTLKQDTLLTVVLISLTDLYIFLQ